MKVKERLMITSDEEVEYGIFELFSGAELKFAYSGIRLNVLKIFLARRIYTTHRIPQF